MKKIFNDTVTTSLTQIHQHNMMKFALCRYDSELDRVVQCHQWVLCRDFMHDIYVGAESNRETAIFGLRYKTTDPRPDPEQASVLLKFPADGATLKNFQNNFHILKNIEESLDFAVSYCELVEYPGTEPVLWLVGDLKWTLTSLSWSLYTYILKCLGYELPKEMNWMDAIKTLKVYSRVPPVEADYMDKGYMMFLLKNLNDLCSKFTTYTGFKDQKSRPIDEIHSFVGFVTLKRLIYDRKDKGPIFTANGEYDTNGVWQRRMVEDPQWKQHVFFEGYTAPE